MKKKSNFGIILITLVDIILLAVILVSAIKEKEGKKYAEEHFAYRQEYDSNENNVTDAVTENINEQEPSVVDADAAEISEQEPSVADADAAEISELKSNETDSFNVQDYSTTARPSLSDFMWYFDGVHYNGLPKESVPIYDSDKIVGDWKGFIFYDPERKFNSYALEFMNVNLEITGQKAEVAFDLYQYCPENSEIVDVTGEIMRYSGNFEAGAVYATGGGNVHIDSFYTMPDKKQYAIGYIDTVDGTPAYIALVRP